jgi:hypothetical protein
MHVCMYVYIYLCEWMHACMMFTYTYVNVCMRIYVYIYMYTCMYTYMYIYIYADAWRNRDLYTLKKLTRKRISRLTKL